MILWNSFSKTFKVPFPSFIGPMNHLSTPFLFSFPHSVAEEYRSKGGLQCKNAKAQHFIREPLMPATQCREEKRQDGLCGLPPNLRRYLVLPMLTQKRQERGLRQQFGQNRDQVSENQNLVNWKQSFQSNKMWTKSKREVNDNNTHYLQLTKMSEGGV